MKNNDGKFRIKRWGCCIALVTGFVGSAGLPDSMNAQTPNPAAAALTDAQALVMLQALAKGQGTGSAALEAAPKKPGTIRIGVVQPKAQMGHGNSGLNVAEPLRATIIQYLSGPAFDVVSIAADRGGMMVGSAAGAAMSGTAGLTSGVKAKSEVSFEYKLMAPGSDTPVLTNSAKAKAKEDGEDIITPLIAQADTAILAELSKKNKN